jgi:general secretion pathway protein G
VEAGMTVVELLITAAIIATLSSIIIPEFEEQLEKKKIEQVFTDIATIEAEMVIYINDHGQPPDSLAGIGLDHLRDPWGNPYQFLNVFNDGPGPPHPRKDHFLHPLNSDYDLYSMGPDGKTNAPLTAKASRDDIIRANNGGYIGIASGY